MGTETRTRTAGSPENQTEARWGRAAWGNRASAQAPTATEMPTHGEHWGWGRGGQGHGARLVGGGGGQSEVLNNENKIQFPKRHNFRERKDKHFHIKVPLL